MGGTINVPTRGGSASIKMESNELADKSAEEVPLLKVDAVDKKWKEAIAHLTMGVLLI